MNKLVNFTLGRLRRFAIMVLAMLKHLSLHPWDVFPKAAVVVLNFPEPTRQAHLLAGQKV